MKKKTLLIYILACVCLTGQAQLQTQHSSVNIGEVSWHSPKSYDFVFQNKARHAVTIIDVVTDCDCTSASWQPGQVLEAGQKTTIRVTYDAQTLGHFRKGVRVCTNDKGKERVEEVWLEGKVVSSLTNYTIDYPYALGEDIYLTHSTVEFDDVQNGDRPSMTIGIANGTKKDYTPTLMHLPDWLTATFSPSILRPGQTGYLTLTADASKVGRYGLAQTSVYVSRYMGDKVSKDNDIQVSLTIVPKVNTTPEALATAPKAVLDTIVTLEQAGKRKARRANGTVTIQNAGLSNLEISRLQVYNLGLQVSLNKSTIQPGQTATLRVSGWTEDEANQHKGRRRILLITNDPLRPKITIDVK